MIALNDREWKEFKIADIFEVSGTVTTKPDALIGNGNVPRITCAATNNGLEAFYKNEATEHGNVLTVDSAAIGYISYQENDFIATDHVEKLTCRKNINRNIGLFFKTVINNAVFGKYNYGYKFSQMRIKRQIIRLPVNSEGEPDYEFMEDYMRYLEQKKILQYLDYINRTSLD